MAYPGEGLNMSIYGAQERSPEEAAGQWKEYTKREERLNNNHIAIKGNGTHIWPGETPFTPEELAHSGTYFKQDSKQHEPSSTYERMFHIEGGYNSHLHRDDRQHTVGLDMEAEEKQRTVAVRSSSEYGRRVHNPLEGSSRKHVRVDKVRNGFCRCRGTGIPSRFD